MIRLLNAIHNKGYYKILTFICSIAYLLKYRKFYRVSYHPAYRAYSFRDSSFTFMSLGPGWAYTMKYLQTMAINTYNYFYLPKNGDVVVDIGAGLGEESLLYGRLVGAGGKVFALEANPITYEGLQYASKQNELKQLMPVNKALYDKCTEIFIEDNVDNYLVNTISEEHTSMGFKVEAIDFDSFVDMYSISSIDFLKVNIEGAEQYLLSSKRHFQKVKNLCISCHDFRENFHQHGKFYVTREKIKEFLLENGYQILYRDPYNNVVDDFIYAKRIK